MSRAIPSMAVGVGVVLTFQVLTSVDLLVSVGILTSVNTLMGTRY